MAAATFTLATGCMIGPKYKTPESTLPSSWDHVSKPQFSGEPINQTEWWKQFHDPALDSLVQQAFTQNLTLQAASLRIVQARIGKVVTAGTLFPLITAQASAAHVNFSQTVKPDVDVTMPNVKVNVPSRTRRFLPPLPPLFKVSGEPSVNVTPKLDVYDAGFDSIWELDLWGEKRQTLQAKNASLQAAYASYDDVMVSLAGEVAATYIRVRVLEQRAHALERNIDLMKRFEAAAQERFEKQQVEVDVQLARTLVGRSEMNLPALEDQIDQEKNALCALLGRAPQDAKGLLGDSKTIPVCDQKIAVGIPADLLRRRPDVRMAERAARAQCARLGSAKAALLPSFSLIGSLGVASTDSDRLFDRDSVRGAYGGVVKATGLVLYPLTVEHVRMEDAEFEEAMLGYQDTVINAAREVDNAMNSYLNTGKQTTLLDSATAAALRSAELALNDYAAGKADVAVPMMALTYQADLQDQRIVAQGSLATDVVALYKALGGGWESRQGKDVLPPVIRTRMQQRSDWWSFAGKYDLNTIMPVEVAEP